MERYSKELLNEITGDEITEENTKKSETDEEVDKTYITQEEIEETYITEEQEEAIEKIKNRKSSRRR